MVASSKRRRKKAASGSHRCPLLPSLCVNRRVTPAIFQQATVAVFSKHKEKMRRKNGRYNQFRDFYLRTFRIHFAASCRVLSLPSYWSGCCCDCRAASSCSCRSRSFSSLMSFRISWCVSFIWVNCVLRQLGRCQAARPTRSPRAHTPALPACPLHPTQPRHHRHTYALHALPTRTCRCFCWS